MLVDALAVEAEHLGLLRDGRVYGPAFNRPGMVTKRMAARGLISNHVAWVLAELSSEGATVGELVEEMTTTQWHESDRGSTALVVDLATSSADYWSHGTGWEDVPLGEAASGEPSPAEWDLRGGLAGGLYGPWGALVGAIILSVAACACSSK
ncbi:MAG: hypothetical protein M3279_02690 [Actinomycetota bacterium]|nr:hypothetical protein [Actinomycetota bacterium]